MNTDELFELLSVVLKRRDVLYRLSNEPADKRTLAGDLDCSRSTVNRAVRELEMHDLVAYEHGHYDLTPLGAQVVAGLTGLLQEIEAARELKPVLQYLPTEQFDLNLQHLADADLYLPEPGNPLAMVNRHVNALKTADDIRAVLPLTGLHATEAVHDRVVNHGAHVEVVGCPEVIQTFLTDPEFAELVAEMEATGRHRIHQLNERPPYFVGIIDELVQIGVDEEGAPQALVESTNPDVHSWAEQIFEQSRRQATRVDPTTMERVLADVAAE